MTKYTKILEEMRERRKDLETILHTVLELDRIASEALEQLAIAEATNAEPQEATGNQTFTFDIYNSQVDKVPVVHIETPPEWDETDGPRCRIYLNDEVIFENPPYPRDEVTQ